MAAATALAVVALAVTGCGRTERVGAGRTVSITLSEYRMAPDKVRMSAGLLTLMVHNYGRLTHNLAVTQDRTTAAETMPIPPGSTAELTVYLPAGKYSLVSTLLQDESLGLHGTLTVTR